MKVESNRFSELKLDIEIFIEKWEKTIFAIFNIDNILFFGSQGVKLFLQGLVRKLKKCES